MKNNEVMSTEKLETEDSMSLKGTLFSVMMVGAFIGVLFVSIFWLYMSRV